MGTDGGNGDRGCTEEIDSRKKKLIHARRITEAAKQLLTVTQTINM